MKAATIHIDLAVYSLEAIKKTLYRLSDRCSGNIEKISDSKAGVHLSFGDNSDRETVLADFHTELVDQDLREVITRQTLPLRNLILAHAFSRTNLVSDGDEEK